MTLRLENFCIFAHNMMTTDKTKEFLASRAPFDVKELLYSYTDMVKFAKEYAEAKATHERVAGVAEELTYPICGLDGFEDQADLEIHLEDCED